MSICWKFVSPYVNIHWTKRFVNHRKTSLRLMLKRLKYENRVKKRPSLFLIKCNMNCKRNPFKPYQPQRRNYNTVYGYMQIPVGTKELK